VTTPISGQFVVRKLVLAIINLHIKFEISIFTHYKYMKGNAKCRICGGLGNYGSPNVTGNATIRQTAYEFLFDLIRNYASILYRFEL